MFLSRTDEAVNVYVHYKVYLTFCFYFFSVFQYIKDPWSLWIFQKFILMLVFLLLYNIACILSITLTYAFSVILHSWSIFFFLVILSNIVCEYCPNFSIIKKYIYISYFGTSRLIISLPFLCYLTGCGK